MKPWILERTAQEMVAPFGGIAALDESPSTAGKRLEPLGLTNDEPTRQRMRYTFVTAPGLREAGVNGVILHEETLLRRYEGILAALRRQDILPGIKIDTGLTEYRDGDGRPQWFTKGHEDLQARLKRYAAGNPAFTKWRVQYSPHATIDVINYNSLGLIEAAAQSQEAGWVPMVEPEVFADGDHTIGASYNTTRRNLFRLFTGLKKRGVYLPGVVLKVNFVTPGKDARPAHPDEVAERTLDALYETVPEDVPGIAFLSGGLKGATEYLNAVNRLHQCQRPSSTQRYTFSFGRELQGEAQQLYAQNREAHEVQGALLRAVRNASLAVQGRYQAA